MVDRTGTDVPNATRANGARKASDAERFRDAITRLWRIVVTRSPQIRAHVGHYVATYVDNARAAGASAVDSVARLVVFAILRATVIVTATVLLLVGLAGGLADALDGRGWLADALVGGGALALFFIASTLTRRSSRRRRLRALVRRHERQDAARPVDGKVTP